MSDNFNYKGYEDYFRELEGDIENSSASSKTPVKRTEAPHKRKRKKGVFKVVRFRKSAIIGLFTAILLIVAIFALPWNKIFSSAKMDVSGDGKVEKVEKVEEANVMNYATSDKTLAIPSSNDAKCAIIVDKSDNTIVAQRNIHTRAYPASTTKIMTLIVAAENLKSLDDTFTMTIEITDKVFLEEASAAGFMVGETVTVKDLLYATILPSGADGALGIAEKLAGSEAEFVKLMNQKVKELGLKNTNFTNVVGLHHKENYSSAYDMAIILDYALKNPLCKEILSTYQFTTSKTKEHPEGILLSSTLFSYMYGTEPETATILGGKTGFVNESGYCIASYGTNNENGNEYIIVTLGNSARWPAFYGQIDLYKEFAK